VYLLSIIEELLGVKFLAKAGSFAGFCIVKRIGYEFSPSRQPFIV